MTSENTDKAQKLEEQLEKCKNSCEEYLNGWKRERADFLNYKKEEMERIGNLVKYANEEIILKLFPVLDNFCLAEKHIPDNDEFKNGFEQIKKQLADFLQKEGIEAIEVMGKEFDPNTMEAVEETVRPQSSHENSGEQVSAESGYVVEEVQRGYTLHGKLIRPAKVRVTK
mgnify:FL=1